VDVVEALAGTGKTTVAGAPKTQIDYRWRLSNHLLPFFHAKRVDEIDAHRVDQFRSFKLREADELRQALRAGAQLRDEDGVCCAPSGRHRSTSS
jgi:hypothetical protein